jgi:hypothetical protein
VSSPALVAPKNRTRLVRRDADVLAEIVTVLERRQEELGEWLSERCRQIDARARGLDDIEVRVERRLAALEAAFAAVEQVVEERVRARDQGVAILRADIETLRRGTPTATWDAQPPVSGGPRSSDSLGTALIYAGCLVLVWLVLWQLGLLFGLT